MSRPPADPRRGREAGQSAGPEHDAAEGGADPGRVGHLLRPAVASILRQNEDARRAFEALRVRGLDEEDAREEIARVLMAVMVHVGAESERVRGAGGGAGLRAECFRALAEGATARELFDDGPSVDDPPLPAGDRAAADDPPAADDAPAPDSRAAAGP